MSRALMEVCVVIAVLAGACASGGPNDAVSPTTILSKDSSEPLVEIVVQMVEGLIFFEGAVAALEVDGDTESLRFVLPEREIAGGWEGTVLLPVSAEDRLVSVWLSACSARGCLDRDGNLIADEIERAGRAQRIYGCEASLPASSVDPLLFRIGPEGCLD